MLSGKNILLGITGSIAAYKSAFLTRLLVKAGANVNMVRMVRSDITRSLLDTVICCKFFRLAKLFLNHGAIAEKKMLGDLYRNIPQDLKELLQQKYDQQECCVCFEHPDDLSDIACPNRHTELLCKICGDKLQRCPFKCGSKD